MPKVRVADSHSVTVGDRHVPDKSMSRANVSTRCQQKLARGSGAGLDRLAHRADVVRADKRVLPCKGRRVTGVGHQRSQFLAIYGPDANNMYREIPVVFGVEAADELVIREILEISVRGHVAVRMGKRRSRWGHVADCFTDSVDGPSLKRVEIGGNEFSAGLIGPFATNVARRVRMPKGKCEPRIVEGRVGVQHRLSHASHVSGPQKAVVAGDND